MTYQICMYIYRIGIQLSVLVNVILGGFTNQSFSARNYEWKRNGHLNMVREIDFLFYYIGTFIFFLINKVRIFLNRPPFCADLSNHCLHFWVYWRARKDVVEMIQNELINIEKPRDKYIPGDDKVTDAEKEVFIGIGTVYEDFRNE